MTVLIAPDKFKGSLTAPEAVAALRAGVLEAYPDATILELPLADGGEGSLDALRPTLPWREHRLRVTGPLRRPVDASYALGEGVAYVESARACGLLHVPPHRRDPGVTTSIGLGQLIEDAVARGAREVNIFLGGSATNDGGAGMAAALGYRFWSDRGHDFVPSGNSLGYVRRLDDERVPAALRETRFNCLYDVDNPLLGERGATFTYARQKGATPEQLPVLEEHLRRFAGLTETQLGSAGISDLPGSGAAGGLGFGCRAFLGARAYPGSDWLLDRLGFDDLLRRADLVLTGEGKIDAQTLNGKVVAKVCERAARAGVPVLAVTGACTAAERGAAFPGEVRVRALLDEAGVTEGVALREAGDRIRKLVGRVLHLG